MLAAGFHPHRRHGPYCFGQIDLKPAHAKNLASARCCQDQELKRTGCDAFPLSQLDQEARQFGVRQCCMVPAQLWSCWQQLIEMSAPPCWIFSRPIAARPRPIQNVFDASAQACGGFRSYLPKRSADLSALDVLL